MFMGGDQRSEYRKMFAENSIADDPTVYLHIGSKKNPKDAPKGCENWFVLVSVPNNSGQDWDRLVAETRKNILRKLQAVLGEEIESHIEQESVLDPRLAEQMTGSSQGAIFGNSSNGKFAAFLRHPNFSSKIDNLYFCGGSVHPGSGVPLCLLSAKITASEVCDDKGSDKV